VALEIALIALKKAIYGEEQKLTVRLVAVEKFATSFVFHVFSYEIKISLKKYHGFY
jgi:hypothetical protein